jgi:hypothetical protein
MDEIIGNITGKESYTNNFDLGGTFRERKPYLTSGFEIGVAEQLKALAELILAGEEHVTHFTLTVTEDSQRMEIVIG